MSIRILLPLFTAHTLKFFNNQRTPKRKFKKAQNKNGDNPKPSNYYVFKHLKAIIYWLIEFNWQDLFGVVER